jgi:hypothetical protein
MHVPLWEPVATVALIAVYLYMRKKNAPPAPKTMPGGAPAPRPPKPQEPPEAVYARLRQKALATGPESLGPAGQVGEGEPYGLLMEMAIPSSIVTLACFADGDAGLYYQSGGGMVGGGSHESVRKAAKEFLELGKRAVPRMTRTTSQPLPEPGTVRFYALTPRGVFTTETAREALEEPGNDLAALFYSGQEVVTQMRQVQGQRGQ